MDKYEYKVKSEELKDLVAQGDYVQAAVLADEIDWRRVKSVSMLCTVSDLYKVNRRYEDARDVLLLAYERRPGSRSICYSLCELFIKTEEFVQAVEFYKEFVQAAPKDPGRYILQYKRYEAQEVSLEERIEVLEELKKCDYREKWAYELAYLYHRIGLEARCVEECDEMILWFGEGKYVIKAMELKMLHRPLSIEQQAKYNHRFDDIQKNSEVEELPEEEEEPTGFLDDETGEIGIPAQTEAVTGDTQVYQPVRAEDLERAAAEKAGAAPAVGVYGADISYNGSRYEDSLYEKGQYEGSSYEESSYGNDPYSGNAYGNPREDGVQENYPEGAESSDEMEIHVKTIDVGQYNTINLQAQIAEGLREVLGEENSEEDSDDAITRSILAPMMDNTADVSSVKDALAEMSEDGVSYEDLGEEESSGADAEESVEGVGQKTEEVEVFFGETGEIDFEQLNLSKTVYPATEDAVMNVEPPKEIAHVLTQEADGQIGLVIPTDENVEKQITGQMSIQDVLLEWERMKKANEEKRREEVHQHVLQQTGNMFTEFEAAVRDGLLERLEKDTEKELQAERAQEEAMNGMLEVTEEPGLLPEEISEETVVEFEDIFDAEGMEDESEVERTSADTEAEDDLQEESGTDEVEEIAEVEETEEVLEESEGMEESDEGIAFDEIVPKENAEETAKVGEFEEAVEEGETVESGEALEGMEAVEAGAETETVAQEAETEITEGEATKTVAESGESGAAETTAPSEDSLVEGGIEYDVVSGQEEPVQKADIVVEDGTLDYDAPDEEAESEEGQSESATHEKVRPMTPEERQMYASFAQSRSTRDQIVKAVDSISLAAYTGNVIITGAEGTDILSLAKTMIREVQATDSNFAGKVAKISGQVLNRKGVEETLEKLQNGALIIEQACDMEDTTAATLYKMLQRENLGLVVVLEDNKKSMNRFLSEHEKLAEAFTARVDVEAMSNDLLVAYGKKYAFQMEYAIDELGVLALHTRIEELQTMEHAVTPPEVQAIVDEAIRHANRRTIGHFFDILFARRYDEEDMIVLTEKDFV